MSLSGLVNVAPHVRIFLMILHVRLSTLPACLALQSSVVMRSVYEAGAHLMVQFSIAITGFARMRRQ